MVIQLRRNVFNLDFKREIVAALFILKFRELKKMDTSVKWTPRVGPCLSLFSLFKMDTSIGQTLSAGPKGVHLIKS